MLQHLKLMVLSASSRIGLTELIRNSRWRRNRLLILCYHGISLSDEHRWNPALYMAQDVFRKRMEHLRRTRCNVLPLAEALERLSLSDLPERSVSVTFDDGWYDFRVLALPVLQEFEIPAALYLTTYYVNFSRPVFDPMLRYLLWKSPDRSFPAGPIISRRLTLNNSGQSAAVEAIENHVKREQLSGRAKDDLLTSIAAELRIDYHTILGQRILQMMNPEEVHEVAQAGIDVQLHTHRHRVSHQRENFKKEIEDNRSWIKLMTDSDPIHFCYPGGNFLPEFAGWLSSAGVRSATTCIAGLCAPRTDQYFLPRFLDSTSNTLANFEAWVAGAAAILPNRTYRPAKGQFLEDWSKPTRDFSRL